MDLDNDATSCRALAGYETSIGNIVFGELKRRETLLARQRASVPGTLTLPDNLADVVVEVHIGPYVTHMQGHAAIGKYSASPRSRLALSHTSRTLCDARRCTASHTSDG